MSKVKPKPYPSAVKCSSCKGHGIRFKKTWNNTWEASSCVGCFGQGWKSAPLVTKQVTKAES